MWKPKQWPFLTLMEFNWRTLTNTTTASLVSNTHKMSSGLCWLLHSVYIVFGMQTACSHIILTTWVIDGDGTTFSARDEFLNWNEWLKMWELFREERSTNSDEKHSTRCLGKLLTVVHVDETGMMISPYRSLRSNDFATRTTTYVWNEWIVFSCEDLYSVQKIDGTFHSNEWHI